MTENVIKLNDYFESINEVIMMKCNHEKIVILTRKDLLVLNNDYEEINDEDSLTFEYWQGVLTVFLILFFVCFCRQKKGTKPRH